MNIFELKPKLKMRSKMCKTRNKVNTIVIKSKLPNLHLLESNCEFKDSVWSHERKFLKNLMFFPNNKRKTHLNYRQI